MTARGLQLLVQDQDLSCLPPKLVLFIFENLALPRQSCGPGFFFSVSAFFTFRAVRGT